MIIAAADFAAIHSATQGIPAMMATLWTLFLLIPCAVLGAGFIAGLYRRLFPAPAAPSWQVRTAKNGRLYACVPGAFGVVWARKGETADQLLARVGG